METFSFCCLALKILDLEIKILAIIIELIIYENFKDNVISPKFI